MAESTIWDKIDIAVREPRIISALIVIVITIPLLAPFGLPLVVTYETKLAYEFVENTLPDDGNVVLINMVSSPAALESAGPVVIAVFDHLFRKPDINIMILNFYAEGPRLFEKLLPAWPGALERYGEDWVMMPFTPGGTVVEAAIASDTWTAIPRDEYDTPVEQIPVMENFRSAWDWDVFISSGISTLPHFRTFQEPYGGPDKLPCLFLSSTMNWAAFRPFLDSGQIVGMTNGMRGGAEYEVLIGRPGTLVSAMDAISSTHVMWLCFIIFGNIVYFGKRASRPREEDT
jgi:hypothetical protein